MNLALKVGSSFFQICPRDKFALRGFITGDLMGGAERFSLIFIITEYALIEIVVGLFFVILLGKLLSCSIRYQFPVYTVFLKADL